MKLSRLARLTMLLSLALLMKSGLVACGVKSSPQHPKGSGYPRQYPEAYEPVNPRNTPGKIKGTSRQNDMYQYLNTVPIR